MIPYRTSYDRQRVSNRPYFWLPDPSNILFARDKITSLSKTRSNLTNFGDFILKFSAKALKIMKLLPVFTCYQSKCIPASKTLL